MIPWPTPPIRTLPGAGCRVPGAIGAMSRPCRRRAEAIIVSLSDSLARSEGRTDLRVGALDAWCQRDDVQTRRIEALTLAPQVERAEARAPPGGAQPVGDQVAAATKMLVLVGVVALAKGR
jgi:hypothetical protein